MYLSLFNTSGRVARALAAAVFLLYFGLGGASARMLDSNGNGMSDVWEWLYNMYGADPNADPDGDGASNLQEALAGTNPLDSNSFPHITVASHAATNFSVTMKCVLGKQYQLQSATGFGGTNIWTVETNVVARSGTSITLTATATATSKFYRVAISDVDSDGDGLTDWEEYQLGLDPMNAMSNGQLDGNGNPMTDYQFAAAMMAQQNQVTIAASDPVTTQPDPGQNPTDLGTFTVSRGGFALNTITVHLATSGPGAGFATAGVDYNNLPSTFTLAAGTTSGTISVTPLANTNLQAPVVAQLAVMSGTNYLLGAQSNAGVVIYPSPTLKGAGLLGKYYTNASTTYSNSANFNPTNLILTRVDPVIDFTWTNGTTPNLSNGLYTVRWTGQVQPQFTETYFFDTVTDDGVRLWVSDQLLIDKWQSQSGTEWTNAITLQAGVRYDIRLEYLQNGGKAQAHLYWYSADVSRQVIPNSSLYPSNSSVIGATNAPAAVTSPLSAVGFVGRLFLYTVAGANTPLHFTATGLPPGLSINATNGLIIGVPTIAGNYQAFLSASNAAGVGASVLNIAIFQNSNSLVREVWTNVPGINISDIPVNTPANSSAPFGALQGITGFGDNYGERLRGYFTAPTNGNYYFWISGSDSAQLWLSDDGEAVNTVLRAYVTPTNNPTAPTQNGTTPLQWNLQSSQQSPWLTLIGGQQYYIEILHKAGVGTNDNWAVGYLLDPVGTNTTPGGITPSYLLSRYYPASPANVPGTLYSANMLALPGINSDAVGSASLRLSADGTSAVLSYSVNGIPGTHVDHIYSDPYLNVPSTLLFDIAAAHPRADGTYLWNITAAGSLQPADILEIINENKCFIEIQTPANPAGEIGGHFTLANGTQNFTAPPAPPSWTDDHTDTNAAVRFLTQATFGASSNDIATVQSLGYSNWINNQLALPATHYLPVVNANINPDPTDPYPSSDWFNAWWQNAITAPDQLRQRVAFALSEITVISENGTLVNDADALASYYDMLLDNAFGNFRALLEAVTLHPAMGVYLNMQGNAKGSIITGIHANENFAREVNQLFSIGLNREWPDGTLVLNSQGNLVPTYTQSVVSGFAATFTGWNYHQANQANGRLPTGFSPAVNYTNPMVLVPLQHDLGAKSLLDNIVLPPASGNATNTGLTNFDYYCSQDLEQAMNAIFNHQNVGPFICRQLIQRLVTSDPSRGYVYRVTQAFNDNGSGVRGDLQAVIKAILLDYEARSPDLISSPTYGKQREPVLRVTATARAFPSPTNQTGTYAESGSQVITVTTPQPHRLNSGDTVAMTFADTSGNPAPPNQNYSVTFLSSTSFSINAPNLLTGTYSQATNVITVNVSGNGLVPGNAVYLAFTTGGGASGLYLIATTNTTTQFTVSTPDSATRSGNCLLPRISASGFVQTTTNITVSCAGPHALTSNETIYIPPSATFITSGQYQVKTIPDPTHFTFSVTNSKSQTQSGFNVYPLGPPPLNRSGTTTVQWSTWNLGYTDTGSSSSLLQSPLRAPTVFNFFYPDYEFPGALASAGLTTPEFQLTSDTGVALQMNFLEGAILNNTGNSNGLSSFTGGDGDIVLDIGPWMTTNYTSAAGIPSLVSNLSSLLLAGQLSPGAQSDIVNYVSEPAQFELRHAAHPNANPRPRSRRRPPAHQFAGLHHPKIVMKEKNVSVITRRDFIRRSACAAVGPAAMTCAIRDLRFMNAAVAQSNISDYKALVCIFLQGGNDSNNLVVPTVASEYNNYASIRTPILALPAGALQTLDGYTDPAGHMFGLHPACPELKTLFGEGKLAILFNTGTLVYPITRAQYLSNSISKPPQLFSHADQVTQWQTSVPDQPALTGWCGRCGDLLNSVNGGAPISLSVSLAGANTLEVGNIVSEYSVSTSGAIALSGVTGARLTALTNILGLPYSNLQSQAYAGVAAHSLNTGALLNNAITNTAAANYWTNNVGGTGFPVTVTTPNGGSTFTSSLSTQLKMVARLIEAGHRASGSPSNGFGMKRQVFFCQVGGYDLHSGQTNYNTNNPNNVILGAHANLFAELSQCMLAFQRGMEQLGLQNNVTTFTASDFGRTFPANGQGSDHGWGSHHLILGGSGAANSGSVLGGQTYGHFPTLTVNGPDDTNTGRWIPTTAIDQYFATIATWFGVDSGNLSTVFPNIGRFSTANLGFMKTS